MSINRLSFGQQQKFCATRRKNQTFDNGMVCPNGAPSTAPASLNGKSTLSRDGARRSKLWDYPDDKQIE
jgi:hypothetical protein